MYDYFLHAVVSRRKVELSLEVSVMYPYEPPAGTANVEGGVKAPSRLETYTAVTGMHAYEVPADAHQHLDEQTCHLWCEARRRTTAQVQIVF